MTTENAIFFGIYIPLIAGMYVTWIIGKRIEKRKRKQEWNKMMSEKSGVMYIPIQEIMRIAREVKRR